MKMSEKKQCECKNLIERLHDGIIVKFCSQCGASKNATMYYAGKVRDLMVGETKAEEWKVKDLVYSNAV